jgi:CheY-like chemotaxis protein
MAPSLEGTLETILVVDDNEPVLEVIIAILKAENFRVLSADSGPAALKLAERTTGTIDRKRQRKPSVQAMKLMMK